METNAEHKQIPKFWVLPFWSGERSKICATNFWNAAAHELDPASVPEHSTKPVTPEVRRGFNRKSCL